MYENRNLGVLGLLVNRFCPSCRVVFFSLVLFFSVFCSI